MDFATGVPTLRRELSLLDSTMINVGSMIGSGIFLVPAIVALSLPAWWMVIAVWLVGGAVSLLGALSVAELGGMYPEAGGQFVYLREIYGPLWGFLYGWTAFAVIMTASIAAVAVAGATYLGYFVSLTPTEIELVAIGSIVILTALNCLGVKVGATAQNGLTILKITMLVLLVVLGVLKGSVSNLRSAISLPPLSGMAGPIGVALVAVLWCYDGWIEISYVAGEVRNPERNIPRSLVLATVLTVLLYLAVNFVYMFILSVEKVSHAGLVAADAAGAMLGPGGASLAVSCVIIALIGCNNGLILTGARIYYAMARESSFFSVLGRIHPRFRTPVASLVAQGAWASVLVLSGTFNQLLTYVIFTSWIFYALTAGAVILGRKRLRSVARPYRTWGYPATPVVFILFSLYLVITTLIDDPRDGAIGLGIVLLGVPLYAWWNRGGPAGGGGRDTIHGNEVTP